MLNWNTDPLLVDSSANSSIHWETANSLLRKGKANLIFQDDFPKLAIYSIIIRKNDFISSERLLQTFPYIILTPHWNTSIRKKSLKVAERCNNYFNNSSLEKSIRSWQKVIISYCEKQQRIPLPIFRLSDNWKEFFINSNKVAFQSARGEKFHLPTKLSPDLSYLLGVIIGDGHLNYHNVVLVDFSKEHMRFLQKLAVKLFGIEGLISGENKRWLLHYNNKWVVRLTNFITDQPIEGKKYDSLQEPLLFQMNDLLRRHFWSGVLDADGCYKKQISLSSSSKIFVQSFGEFLSDHDINFKIRKLQNPSYDGYTLTTDVKAKRILGRLLLPRHIDKLPEFQNYIKSKIYQSRKIRNDEISLLMKEKHNLRFKSFNEKNIINEKSQQFFDFSNLHRLAVLQCQGLLKGLRKHLSWSQKELANYLSIPEKVLTSYENRIDLPIQLLEKLLPLFPDKQPKTLMLFLQKNNLNHFRSRKTVAKLDLQPTKELSSIVKNLELRRNYLLIKFDGEDKEAFLKKLANHFEITRPTSYKLSNSVIFKFAKIFCKY